MKKAIEGVANFVPQPCAGRIDPVSEQFGMLRQETVERGHITRVDGRHRYAEWSVEIRGGFWTGVFRSTGAPRFHEFCRLAGCDGNATECRGG